MSATVTVIAHTNGLFSMKEGRLNGVLSEDVLDSRLRFLGPLVHERVSKVLSEGQGTLSAQTVLRCLFEYRNVFPTQ